VKNSVLIKYWNPLLAITFWGASFIATKTALAELSPVMIIFFRLILGSFFLTSIALIKKRSFKINLHSHGFILILAFIVSFHLWIQVTGLQFTSATNTGWIIGITPVFMAVLGYLFFKESLNIIQLSGISIAFTGLILLISKGNLNSIGFISNKGDFLVLASAVTWSIYSAVNKKISLSYSPFMTILYLFLMVVIFLLPFNLNAETYSAIKTLSVQSWVSILFLGIFCSGIAYVLWSQALRELPASKVGVFLYFEPFVTVFTAWVILNEKASMLTFFSGIVITFGVVLVNKKG
jgi:RarD protein